MTSSSQGWGFEYRVSSELPPLAWIARVRGATVEVRCGASVRKEPDGFFEGTWAGESDVAAAARATTVFGSGMVLDGRELIVVSPAHTLEPVYSTADDDGSRWISNSFAALLVAAERTLDPDVRYPPIFGLINRGISYATFDVPTRTRPITVNYYDNLLPGGDGSIRARPKPHEEPFTSFADYRDRLTDRVRSAFANAPAYEPAATISSGYDSTASAVIGAGAGCRRALTFRTGWPWLGYHGEADSGETAAKALGMSVEFFDRLAYYALDDAPEAEFLANGMSGEDVVYRSMEPQISRTILLTGFWGGAAWRGDDRSELKRVDLSGASMTEFRLRNDFIHLPVPYIGGMQQPSLARLRHSPAMRPFSVGGVYDEPVPRRLAEEAGVPRGTFGVQKLANSQRIHRHGLAALSTSGRAAFEAFCGPGVLEALPERRPITGADRLKIKVAHRLRLGRLVEATVRRKYEIVQNEPVLGSLLLRWAVEAVKPRYGPLRSRWGAR